MRLSDLLARSVSVEAHEAIAVVRGVSQCVLESSVESSVPELHQIELSPEGEISLTGGVKTSEPVRRLGQLLQALLTQSAPPVQLRLVISQATAPQPTYGSIGEFSEALAYFERPGRAAVIRALHARALEALESIEPGPTPTLDAMAPLPGAPAKPPSIRERRTAARGDRRPLLLVVTVALVAAVCGSAAIFYARIPRSVQERHDVSKAVVKASDAVGSALLSGASALTERAGLGRLVSASEAGTAAAAAPVPKVAASAAAPARQAHAAPRTPPAASFQVFDLDAQPPLDDVALPARDADPRVAARRNGSDLSASLSILPFVSVPDVRIYSPESDGVVPPVSVRPQFRRQLPENVNMADLGRIELIILEDGTVSSVKLLTPASVSDGMMLSAAKAWEFQPAQKDGHPVKFRKVVWMTRQ